MNKLSFIWVFMVAFLPLQLFSQQHYQAKIIDSKTRKGIPKATIKLASVNLSVETDKTGNFSIDGDAVDTLMVSCIGYKTIKIAINDLQKSKIIPIEEEIKTLKELNISDRKRKAITLNNYSETMMGVQGFQLLAQKMIAPAAGGLLTSVIINRNLAEAGANPQTKFKLRIYDLDPKSGGPGKELLEDGLLVTNKNDQRIKVDLTSHQIFISGKTFFVAVEWLLIPFNEFSYVGVNNLVVALDSNGDRVPWANYQGQADYLVGTSGHRPEGDKTYQRVKGNPEGLQPLRNAFNQSEKEEVSY